MISKKSSNYSLRFEICSVCIWKAIKHSGSYVSMITNEHANH